MAGIAAQLARTEGGAALYHESSISINLRFRDSRNIATCRSTERILLFSTGYAAKFPDSGDFKQ
jgi:hypothetical protein